MLIIYNKGQEINKTLAEVWDKENTLFVKVQ